MIVAIVIVAAKTKQLLGLRYLRSARVTHYLSARYLSTGKLGTCSCPGGLAETSGWDACSKSLIFLLGPED